jgi:hypothetical protein
LVHLRREHEDIALSRTGRLRLRRRDHPFTVQKRYRFKESAVECTLLLRNDSAADLELWYGLEVNLALASRGEAHLLALKGSQKKELGTERAEADKLEGVLVRDPANEAAITLESANPFSLWSLPVETVSYPPAGRSRQYQSNCLVLSWKFSLAAGEQWEGKLTLRLEKE